MVVKNFYLTTILINKVITTTKHNHMENQNKKRIRISVVGIFFTTPTVILTYLPVARELTAGEQSILICLMVSGIATLFYGMYLEN